MADSSVWGRKYQINSCFYYKVSENLLLDKHHELKNRFMHIDYKDESAVQSAIIALWRNLPYYVKLQRIPVLRRKN